MTAKNPAEEETTMTRPMRIAFDVDGVLRDLIGHVLGQLNDGGFFSPPRLPEELDRYEGFVELFRDNRQWRETLDGMNAWTAAPPIKPMVRVWEKLVAAGYDCVVVTSIPHKTGQINTVRWLHEHLDVEGLEVHFVNDKMTVEFDAIIEDMPLNVYLAGKAGRLGFLVKRPWTKSDNLLRGTDPRFRVHLPDDGEALSFIEDKLMWYKGFFAGAREFSDGRSFREGSVRKGGLNDPPTSPRPEGHPGPEPRS